jgi:hypothetical protein
MITFNKLRFATEMPMERALSTPLRELPSFLSTISMVVDDRPSIVKRLTNAERKSPSTYEPARDLFCRVLQGDLTLDQALVQARKVADSTDRKCAVDVLQASARFLQSETPARAGQFPAMSVTIPNGMKLTVAPIWLRHLDPQRLMVLHFWRKPLTSWQLGAAAAVLRLALVRQRPGYSGYELDFISVSEHEATSERRFERYGWTALKPLDEQDLSRFWKQFCGAWSEYQKIGPREFRRRRQESML